MHHCNRLQRSAGTTGPVGRATGGGRISETRTEEDLMSGSNPLLPQTAANFSSSDNSYPHTILFPHWSTAQSSISPQSLRVPYTFFKAF